jgi:hypothetical protein
LEVPGTPGIPFPIVTEHADPIGVICTTRMLVRLVIDVRPRSPPAPRRNRFD